jgi:hypothetical protein
MAGLAAPAAATTADLAPKYHRSIKSLLDSMT